MAEDAIKDYAADGAVSAAPEAPADVTLEGKKRRGRPAKAAAEAPSEVTIVVEEAPAPPAPETPIDARTRLEMELGAATLRRNQELLNKAE